MKTPEEIKKAIKHCIEYRTCKGCPYWDNEVWKTCFGIIERDALTYIEQLEAENKRLHASWVKRKEDAIVHWDCSRCGIGFLDDAGLDKLLYCPHCGAKMDEKVNT